jgi:pimeloyl-ACP methyl ester carboxylesterase
MDTVIADQRSELDLTLDTLAAAKPHWDLRDVEAKIAAIGQVDPEAVVRTWTDTGSWDVTDAARALAIPTLLLGGDPAEYTMLEPADATAIAADNPRIDYYVLPGSGHSPHRDVPDLTRERMMGWLHDE